MRGYLRQVPLRTDGSKLCCVSLCQPVTRGKLRIYSGCKQYLMALGSKFWHYLPHCTVLWSSDCPEASYPSRGSRVDCQRKKEQGQQRHLSCEQANNEGTVPNYIGYNTSKIPWLVLSSTQQDTTLVPGLSLDCACEMLESCSLECQNVAKKIAKNPISCFLNFKSYYLNFLIFLYKR